MQNEDHALLPCPFCGEPPEVSGGDHNNPWVVECVNPDCPVLCAVDGADTKKQAITAWNTRAALSATPTPEALVEAVVDAIICARRKYQVAANAKRAEAGLWPSYESPTDDVLARAVLALPSIAGSLQKTQIAPALVEEAIGALEPFVQGYSHTSVFLKSRQKMHPAGQDLYAEDVERARATLAKLKEGRA